LLKAKDEGRPKGRPTIAIHKLCDEEMETREPKHICIVYMYRYVCMYVCKGELIEWARGVCWSRKILMMMMMGMGNK
jgi:hypothetical protein